MEIKERYPEYIIRYLRQRKELDEDDTSHDEQLQTMGRHMSLQRPWNGMVYLVAGTTRSKTGSRAFTV